MKKLVLLIMAFILLLLGFFYYIKMPKNYTYLYKYKDYQIKEKYNKEKKYYLFDIKKNKKVYKYAIKSNYISKRGLVDKVTNKDKCITFSFNRKASYNVCLDGKKSTTNYYKKHVNTIKTDKYKNINIYDLMNHTYYVWNYNEFLHIDGKNNNKVNIFDSDIYELKIITTIDDYLIVADYNEKYQFNTFYVIDTKTNKVKKVEFNRKFSLDSIILGTYKKNIYLYDYKQEKEYKIDVFKQTVDDYPYQILVNNNWEKVSVHKLNKGNIKFYNDEDFRYELKNNKLYYIMPNVEILVSDMDVSNIVLANDNDCYFISEDSLYHVNINNKITKIMSYSEWQFNNKNIYIF